LKTIRAFRCDDMFRFNNVLVLQSFTDNVLILMNPCLNLIDSNLDPLTETYGLSFYLQYLAHWPECFQVVEAPNGHIMGYSRHTTDCLTRDD